MAAQSEVWFCDPTLAGIEELNPAVSIAICL